MRGVAAQHFIERLEFVDAVVRELIGAEGHFPGRGPSRVVGVDVLDDFASELVARIGYNQRAGR